MNISNKYSLISIMNGEQFLKYGYAVCSPFATQMYESLTGNFNNKGYILLNSTCRSDEEVKWLCSRIMSQNEIIDGKSDYRLRHSWQPFGIIPVIPYKYVSNVAKNIEDKWYSLGFYPKRKIFFEKEPCDFYGGVPGWIYAGSTFTEESFKKTEDKISLPSAEGELKDGRLIIKDYSIYKAVTLKGEEIRAIKYHNNWFKVEPVNWVKIDDYLFCECVLFQSPIHCKNDYVTNDNNLSFDNTFLKWYIDNIFTRDLLKNDGIDYDLIEKQVLFRIDEDIDTKLKEIERLKQMKANLILQQQSEEHIIDTAHRNITGLFEEDSKEQEVRRLHK